jgi:hypothetical protein
MERDKNSTKQKLIDAVGRIVVQNGFHAVGINSVAKEANVDKVLIYRYFNGLEGLIQEFINQKDYFINKNSELKISDNKDVVELGTNLFLGQLRDLISNKALQEILLWELTNDNEITKTTAEKREQEGMKILNEINKIVDFNKTDIPAITSIVLAGIYFLVLRSRNVDVFNGIDLTNENGWSRIENAISFILRNSLDPKNER